MKKFYNPVKTVDGVGIINNINDYVGARKVLLVTSEGFVKRGLVDKLKNLLGDKLVYVHSKVASHPEVKHLKEIYNTVLDVDFEVIVAVGGGSVLDTAKALAVYADNQDFSYVEGLIKGSVEKSGYSLHPIIGIPTTSGTGSEVTPWATIWDMDEKKKFSLHLPDLFCEYALYDASLTYTLPEQLTLQTGLDTLSHALESIWNKNANETSTKYAVEASKTIVEFLPKLMEDFTGENSENCREELMVASKNAGLAFSNTQTSIAHAMSYFITIQKGIDHGIACSFTIPLIIEKIFGKFDVVDASLKAIFGENPIEASTEFFKKMNVSTKFEDYGMDSEDVENLKKSLENNQRAGNSIIGIDELFG